MNFINSFENNDKIIKQNKNNLVIKFKKSYEYTIFKELKVKNQLKTYLYYSLQKLY